MPVPAPEGPALGELFSDDQHQDKKPRVGTTGIDFFSDLSNPMVMRTYYTRIFPFKQTFNWLNQSRVPTKNFTHREFALTLQNDVYIRYNSFANAEEFKEHIVKLNPARFEIGPVYSARPKDRKTLLKAALKPQLRELVFDIDMTDYDSIRTCCQDKAMCQRCWRFISMAVKVLDKGLRDDFGFKHLLWVYSGRRGIHLWISDPAALALSDDQRKAIVNYVELIKGGAKMDKKVDLKRPLHPSIARAQGILRPYFDRVVLQDQNCFINEDQWDTVLRILPDKHWSSQLKKQFPPGSRASSAERWAVLLKPSVAMTSPELAKFKQAVEDVVLQYTYPRIDTEVSKHLNHLLKAPFCIHPGTGRVCVPLLPEQVDNFVPEEVPTVGQLLVELEELSKGENPNTSAGWESTSLRPYVDIFQRHVDAVLKDARGAQQADKDTMDF